MDALTKYTMPTFLSISEKRPLKMALGACFVVLGVLGGGTFAHASTVIYSEAVVGGVVLVYDDGLIDASTTGADIWYNVNTPAFGGNNPGAFGGYEGSGFAFPPNTPGTTTVQYVPDQSSIQYPFSTYFCIDSVGSYPTPCTNWVYLTINGTYVPGQASNVYLAQPTSLCNGSTCISSVSPSNTEIATSTSFDLNAMGTISAKDALNIDEFITDMTKGLSIKWSYGLVDRLYASCPLSTVVATSCPIPFAGALTVMRAPLVLYNTGTQDFTVSTTSPGLSETGIYQLNVEIDKPTSILGLTSVFGINLGYTQIAATSTTFTVATSTAYQRYMAFLLDLNTSKNTLNATTTQAALDSCLPVPGFFNLSDCVTVLFTPTPGQIDGLIQTVHDGILTRAPVGYVTRLVTIFAGTATTTPQALPSFTVQFANVPQTGLQGLTYTINMQDMMDAGSSTMAGFVDPISGKSLREITEPYILLIIAISALIIIFHDTMGIPGNGGRDSGYGRNSGEKYREWLYEHKQ